MKPTFARPLALAAAAAAAAAGLVLAAPALAQQAPPPDPLRFEDQNGFVKLGIEAGVQAIGNQGAFWNLARRFAPTSNFTPNLGWGEGYFKPSVVFERRLTEAVALYGGASLIASGTVFRDFLGGANSGRVMLENAFAGLRYGRRGEGLYLDISAGAQPYRIGSGMLISDGAADGFERGAVVFGPRQAWAMTAIARVGYGPVLVEGFYLDPNELRSNDTRTTLAGVNAQWTLGPNQFVGVAVGQVLRSTAPYPQAAPGGIGAPLIITDARNGLQFLNAYARFNPLAAIAPGLWIAADLALQRNDRIAMSAWAGRIEIGYVFADLPWRPTLSYAYQTFSGDKVNTARLERFDPLFYDGGQNAWATGANGSLVFINSNVNAHRFTANFTISPQDLLTLRYAHIRANELNSPIQFGQATRFGVLGGSPGLVSGVPSPHLADDFMIEYTRVLSANAFLTLGLAHAIPGSGLKAAAAPQRLVGWTGGFANLVIRY